jgi:hypothetical protein
LDIEPQLVVDKIEIYNIALAVAIFADIGAEEHRETGFQYTDIYSF